MKTTWPASRIGRRSRGAVWAGAALALLLSGAAHAQSPEDLAKARTLFREAVALSAANNWSGALTKFKAVAQVKMTAQVAFNIAECEEHLGKLLSALGNYRLAASEAAAPKANAADVAKQVDARISALEARIPKLTINRGQGAETASIELDGTELGSAQIGAEIAVDPGPHLIVGKVNGNEGSRETVTIAEKETKSVNVAIDASAPKKPDTPVDTGPKPDTTPPPDTTAKPGSKIPGAVVTGLGVASLGAGIVFMIVRQGTISDLEDMCGTDGKCPPSAQDTSDKGKLFTGLAEVTIPLGVIGIATGIVLLVTSSKGAATPAPAAASRVRFLGAAPGASLGGASIIGRF